MDIIKAIEEEYKKQDVKNFNIGDTVDVHVKIKEGNRERIQIFTGTVIKCQNSGLNETFTVRKISNGVGVERTFPMHSPKIAKVEVKREGKVRRAKLYYLRDRVGKSAKTKENLGARIENKEITVKEEMIEEAKEEAPSIETTNPVVEEVVDTVKEEVVEEVKEEPAKKDEE